MLCLLERNLLEPKQTLDFRRKTKTMILRLVSETKLLNSFNELPHCICNVLYLIGAVKMLKRAFKILCNRHTYCCCILPYNIKNNSLALVEIYRWYCKGIWKWNNISLRGVFAFTLNKIFRYNKKETHNNQPVFQKGHFKLFYSHLISRLMPYVYKLYFYTVCYILHFYTPWNKHYNMLSSVLKCSLTLRGEYISGS